MISFVTGDIRRKLRHHANHIINNKKTKSSQYFHPRPQPYPGDLNCFFFLSAATSAHKYRYRTSRRVNTAALPGMTAPELTPPIAFRLLYRRHSALSYPYKLGQRSVKQYPPRNMSTVIKPGLTPTTSWRQILIFQGLIAYIDRAFSLLTAPLKN